MEAKYDTQQNSLLEGVVSDVNYCLSCESHMSSREEQVVMIADEALECTDHERHVVHNVHVFSVSLLSHTHTRTNLYYWKHIFRLNRLVQVL